MKAWSLSGRLAAWSATFSSALLLLLAIAVALIAMWKQVSALDIRLADQGARFFHEWRERDGVAPAPHAADALKQLHFIGGMRVTTSDGQLLYATPDSANVRSEKEEAHSRRMLIGVDGSESSMAALECGLDLAKKIGSEGQLSSIRAAALRWPR